MKSAMPGQPSLVDYGKLRAKSNISQNILKSLALVTISIIDRPGATTAPKPSPKTANAKVSHMI
jgi:hypothetical protein